MEVTMVTLTANDSIIPAGPVNFHFYKGDDVLFNYLKLRERKGTFLMQKGIKDWSRTLNQQTGKRVFSFLVILLPLLLYLFCFVAEKTLWPTKI